MSVYKTLKDTRRRISQTVLSKVGSADETKDVQYDAHVEHFHSMISDMNQCEELIVSLLQKQSELFAQHELVAKTVANIYEKNKVIQDWPDVDCELIYDLQADQFKDTAKVISKLTRATAQLVITDKAVDPIHSAVVMNKNEIEKLTKDRNIKVTDYDSYRRRLSEKEAKRVALMNKGKGETPAAAENLADIEKFKNKTQRGLEEFMYVNEKVKVDIQAAKADHDEIMDNVLITLLVTQEQLYSTAAKQLDAVISTLPEERVNLVKERFNAFFQSGAGVAVSSLGSGSTTGADRSRFIYDDDEDEDSSSATSTAPIIPTIATPTTETSLLDLSDITELPPPPSVLPVNAPVLPPADSFPPSNGTLLVKALFDHEGEDEDELNFSTGDLIEVVDQSDEGWWRGRFNGAEGLFPANYVEKL